MSMDGFKLDGKVALVTGAAQGIGRAISIALADAGATVVVSDIAAKSSAVDAVCVEITAAGGTASACELDVTATSRLAAVFDGVVADSGRLDILVNNAGILVRKPALEITEEDWDRVFSVNLRGLFFCAQAAAKHMVARGDGRIINIASQRALSASAGNAPYIASKAAVAGLTRALALDWISSGITVNAVGPGPVDTPLLADASPEMDLDIVRRSPAGRRLQPEEIAGAVVYLASPAAAAVNGHLLLVDAGWTIA
ncbi:MAG: SDR family oxidoreductase [Chloroflexi bacterium]|nr:SDR family oxidoreductase [Chloroflexota bacterium]